MKPQIWDVLDRNEELQNADISLLCEASPAPSGVDAVGSGRTIGLGDQYESAHMTP